MVFFAKQHGSVFGLGHKTTTNSGGISEKCRTAPKRLPTSRNTFRASGTHRESTSGAE